MKVLDLTIFIEQELNEDDTVMSIEIRDHLITIIYIDKMGGEFILRKRIK